MIFGSTDAACAATTADARVLRLADAFEQLSGRIGAEARNPALCVLLHRRFGGSVRDIQATRELVLGQVDRIAVGAVSRFSVASLNRLGRALGGLGDAASQLAANDAAMVQPLSRQAQRRLNAQVDALEQTTRSLLSRVKLILAGSAVLSALAFTPAAAACIGVGTVTCSGNPGAMAYSFTPPIDATDTLIVTSLTANVQPASGTVAASLTTTAPPGDDSAVFVDGDPGFNAQHLTLVVTDANHAVVTTRVRCWALNPGSPSTNTALSSPGGAVVVSEAATVPDAGWTLAVRLVTIRVSVASMGGVKL